MGCDIHLYVEYKNTDNEWVSADEWRKPEHPEERVEQREWTVNNRADYEAWSRQYDGPTYEQVLAAWDSETEHDWNQQWYGDRHYNLFTHLAGVRDYGDGIPNPIPPRGLPDDTTANVVDEWRRMFPDGHTPSWWTLEELLENPVPTDWSFWKNQWPDMIERLQEIDSENVRIVFWFDN